MWRPLKLSSRSSAGSALLALGLMLGCKDSSGPPANAAASLAVHSGNNQGANTGTAVPQPLAVLVTDADGAPLSGVAVTFAVTTGGGTITGGTARTGSDGVATAGTWTLGNSIGANTVEATVTGLPSVTFTAQGRCTVTGDLVIGTPLTGALATTDCRYPAGELTDRYTLTTAVQRAVRFFQTSTAFDTYLEVYDATSLLAANDDSAGIANYPTSTFKMILAPGSYEVSPSSYDPAKTGSYSLSAVAVPENENICELVFAVAGITTAGELATGDCATGGSSSFLYEPIAVVLRAGRAYTITLNSTAFDAYLELGTLNGGPPVASSDNAVGTNARIVYTPTVTNYYAIFISTAAAATAGAYTLIIE